MIQTIEWINNKVVMIDQTRLPMEEVYREYDNYKDVAQAIKNMVIRGAPAIGVAAAMGIALGAQSISADSYEEFSIKMKEILEEMAKTRPTAVNLFWAIEEMRRCAEAHRHLPVPQLKEVLKNRALQIRDEDIQINKILGKYGAQLIKSGDTILTHCNAGALATAGYGTALGVIRSAHEEGKQIHVFVDETRPFLQGSRLTAWELAKENIPLTLITDNMAGYFMRKGKINLIIVGADRIAANGDVANKIGTYSLAVLAKEHGIPFYVAAPISTLDLSIGSGDQIPIEERNPQEVTQIAGKQIAPEAIQVANPAFDVTPHEYITAIITEKGIAWPPYEESLAKLAR
ncbi:MAG TPA: S-methyl-5-thioribose-1-phosphate isomerase [Candidatus Limnocylindrales bacterium]|nr:S-methyl-5-thioribose-1-phosphate isomerase [Candidatus Limnocylindrales bacterium]